ncbi:MAG TPA: DUF2299 domain-containing protein [Candidatus Poseidoniales archaeon]|nr:DUF2299 domain-containing protein [Candidatus Poseidoniales archaeon]
MADEMEANVRNWLTSEGLEVRDRPDPRARFHLLVRYPPTPHGHVFNIASPKQRDLVVVSTVTQVDAGQQDEMVRNTAEDGEGWESWLHDTRLHLTRSGVDWVLHVRNSNEAPPGPLQAFNLSQPIWSDGLSQNELMQTLRHLWLTKLALIHEIKYSYGPGVGRPGPVDDWQQAPEGAQQPPSTDNVVSTDEGGTFGSGFDPSEWL